MPAIYCPHKTLNLDEAFTVARRVLAGDSVPKDDKDAAYAALADAHPLAQAVSRYRHTFAGRLAPPSTPKVHHK